MALKSQEFENQLLMEHLREMGVCGYIMDDVSGRIVEVTDMAGGRYLFIDENGYVSGQADQEFYAVLFLTKGGYVKERYAGTAKVS